MDFLTNNSNYVVLTIVLIIWAGLASFMFSLNSKVNNIEKQIKDK